ncbi:MAG TPA: DoxX family protein [Terracidiphilus sp.]|nr:DoxX family protein [Terracidiphilus sp.]
MAEERTASAGVGRGRLWTGRVLSILTILFLLFDATGKLMKPVQVTQGFALMGMPIGMSVPMGVILLACIVLYAIPRTAAAGALVLTGYLGGAVALQWRVANPVFETIFPVLFAVMMWAGLVLRDRRLEDMVLFRR